MFGVFVRFVYFSHVKLFKLVPNSRQMKSNGNFLGKKCQKKKKRRKKEGKKISFAPVALLATSTMDFVRRDFSLGTEY